jgi:hypothetical protein
MRKKIVLFSGLLFITILAVGGIYLLLARDAHAASGEQEESSGRLDPFANKPRYSLSIDLSFDLHRADVRERMGVTNRTGKKWERLVFSVPPAANGSVFQFDSLRLKYRNKTDAVVPVIRGSMLSFSLPDPVFPGDAIEAEMSFRLSLPRLDPYDVHPKGNQGYGDKVMQFGDFFPTLTPFDPESGFREWEYVPVGDPYVYVLSDYEVEINTDPGVLVAAAGLVSHDGQYYQFKIDNARTFAFTASKQYDLLSASALNIPIYCFYVKGNTHAAEAMLTTARECLELYSMYYGPYPYRELVLAQNAYASAMEYSGFVTISNINIINYTDEKPQLLLYLVAHEISHQWWYGAVGNDEVREPWLDEALAKYSEFLYFRAYHPQFTEWWQSLTVVQWPADRFIDDTIYEFRDTRQDYMRVIYGLAPLFIQELHDKIGEQTFFEFLRDYRSYGENRIVTKKDFFAVLGRHTSEDIAPLVNKYFRFPP